MDHQIMNSLSGRYESRVYEGRSWSYHFHNSFELIYVFSGQMRVTVNDRDTLLSKGECLLISPCMAHRIFDSEGCRFFIAIFAEDYVPEWAGEAHSAAFYHFTPGENDLSYLRAHMLRTGEPERYRLRSCLYAVCARAKEVGGETMGMCNMSFVYAVNRYIAEHINLHFKRRDIAEHLGYEEHYFSSLFRHHFGLGFQKYLHIYRFSMAQQLLLTTDRSMAEIAFLCGFSSVRSFNDVFREFSGKTPSEYRKEKGKEQGKEGERT